LKIGVLGSGKGSNFDAIFKAVRAGALTSQIAVVISDHSDAPILQKAKAAGIPSVFVEPGKYKTFLEPAAEEKYVQCLQSHGAEWIVLAGFMRVIKAPFFKAYRGKIINVHPSLLPAFKGLEAWRQAVEYGSKVTGVSVHFVDEEIDTGPIILQEAVPVLDQDTPATLHARIQEAEHRLYPEALQIIQENRYRIEGRSVRILPAANKK
jgi:phosphoribosylglycinamide formyltransferase-1